MISYGSDQWGEDYPTIDVFENDIKNQDLYVLEENNIIKAFICLNLQQADEYKNLTWSDNSAPLVIHRMSIDMDYKNQGIGLKLMKFAEETAKKLGLNYIRTDTYSLNYKAQNLFLKCGYNYIGNVHFPKRDKNFKCYDKIVR